MAAAVGDVKRDSLVGCKNSRNSYEINQMVGPKVVVQRKKESLVRIWF
jgi:hypothetical protein